MNARPLLLLIPLALWACQDALYPVAPDVPERVTIGSPDPGSSTSPVQRGPYGGQLVASGNHYLEFVGFTPAGGDYTLYLFPWDASMNPVFRPSGKVEAKFKVSNGKEMALSVGTNNEDGSLFFYAFPEATFKNQSATIQAEVTLGTTPLTGSFVHPDR